MKTTLTCVEAGVYRVRRIGDHWDGPATLRKKPFGWEIVWAGPYGFGRVVDGFGSFAKAQAWLDGADGQAWLDALPRAEVTS